MGLFKKPKPQEQSSSSGNHAWEPIKNAFSPALGYVTKGGDALSALLGLNGDGAAQKAALDNFANSAGMQWQQEQGNRMINSNQAAIGLLQSGSTLTGIQKYAQGLGSTYLNSYMDKLLGLGNLGIGAGGVMASAGQWSKSKGTGATQGGAGKSMLPMIASAAITAASDERLKENVVAVGERLGMTEYEFNYKKDSPVWLPKGRFRGFMAQDILNKFPDAVEDNGGYLFVNDKKFFPTKVN
jgi:hypothetical protein